MSSLAPLRLIRERVRIGRPDHREARMGQVPAPRCRARSIGVAGGGHRHSALDRAVRIGLR